ncbi:MAG: protein kinase [Phycisphaerales bacterium]|nr:protein kinase [Phycisphaerales bacterium]MCB9836177.1 protein kinase [Phycisphaera sp.]
MGDSEQSCPGPELLELVATGDVGSDSQHSWVVSHVTRCRACAAFVETERFARRFGATLGGSDDPTLGNDDAPPAIAGYSIIREIARGGHGVVYEAEQSATGQRVAIKVLHSAASTSGGSRAARARFQREIQIAGTLSHQGIVRPVDSLCLTDGRDALILELVEGESLGLWARHNREPHELIGVLAQVADALEHAHQRGVIHRDLKPSNVLVDTEGRARVLDFGVARRRSAGGDTVSDRVTLTGEFTGTLAYAAPEQVSQAYAGPDVRSDVYALGVMGYEALTGRLPYEVDGSLETVIRNIVNAETPGAAESRLERDIWTVLAKAMSKEPSRRYQSAGELARDLRRAAQGEAIEARRDSRWYVVRKGVRRHRLLASVLLAVMVGLLGVAVALGIGNVRLSAALHESTIRQLRAHIQSDARARAEEILWPVAARSGIGHSTDRATELWSGSRAALEAMWAFVEMQSRSECLRVISRGEEQQATLRAFEDGTYGVLRLGGGVARLTPSGIEEGASLPSDLITSWFLPGGRFVVSRKSDGFVSFDATTGDVVGRLTLNSDTPEILGMAFSDWGICISRVGGGLELLSIPEFDVIWTGKGISGGQTVWLDPGRRCVAWLNEPGVLELTDLDEPTRSRHIGLVPGGGVWGEYAAQVLLDQRGNYAAVLLTTGAYVLDLGDPGAEAMYHRWAAARITGAMSPDGSLFATREYGSPNAIIWRTDTIEPIAILPGHATAASDLCFSVDGSRILTSDRLGVLREWATPGQGWEKSLGEPTARGLDIAIRADGRGVYVADAIGRAVFLSSDETEYVWPWIGFPATKITLSAEAGYVAIVGESEEVVVGSISDDSEISRWRGDGSWVASARFSPSGDELAVSTRDGRVVLLNSVTCEELARYEVGSGAMTSSLRWSPEGNRIAVGARDGTVSILDADRLELRSLVHVFLGQVRSIEWSSDGEGVWAAGDEGTIAFVSVTDGRVRYSDRISEHSLFAMAPHRDGHVVLVGDRAGTVYAIDTSSLRILAELDVEQAVLSMEFDTTGNALYISAMNRPVRRWDLGVLARSFDEVRPRAAIANRDPVTR